MTAPYTLHLGNCIEVLRGMADNSIDACVTDSPYGLSKEPDMMEVLRHWMAGDDYAHKGAGFMGKKWDSFVPGPSIWREVFRVLKPGGYLLTFFGTRTYDMGALAVRLAGFEIRDQIAWTFGSGFPKSLNVSKAIDKAGGTSTAWFGSWLKQWREQRGLSQKELCERCGFFGSVNRGGTVANWELGLGQPTVEQFNKIVEVLELPFASIEEVEREVVGRKKVAAGVAFSSTGPTELDITVPATSEAQQWDGWGTALKPAWEPICMARKPLAKGLTVAGNVLAHGTGALNIDGCRVDGGARPLREVAPMRDDVEYSGNALAGRVDGTLQSSRAVGETGLGRWPANLIHDGSSEVLAAFPQAAGQLADVSPTAPSAKTSNVYGAMRREGEPSADSDNDGVVGFKMKPGARRLDSGSAARFFYCAKASRKDRNEGCEDMPRKALNWSSGTQNPGSFQSEGTDKTSPNAHPTVKPTALMRHLVRMVTPPGGIVLDHLMGSGSTGKACMLEGFQFIGIDMMPEHVAIAEARIAHAWRQVQAAQPTNDNTEPLQAALA